MASNEWKDVADEPTDAADRSAGGRRWGSGGGSHGDVGKLHVVLLTSGCASLCRSLSSPLTLHCRPLTLKQATKSIHHSHILKRGEN